MQVAPPLYVLFGFRSSIRQSDKSESSEYSGCSRLVPAFDDAAADAVTFLALNCLARSLSILSVTSALIAAFFFLCTCSLRCASSYASSCSTFRSRSGTYPIFSLFSSCLHSCSLSLCANTLSPLPSSVSTTYSHGLYISHCI